MNKKGFEISSVLGWILGILAVFIILFIVLGPEQLLSTAREAAFSFNIGVPGGGAPTAIAGDNPPQELKDYLNRLSTIITDTKSGERCLIPLPSYTTPKPKDNFFIALSPGYVSIKKKMKENSYTSTSESISIPGFQPCIVAGKGAENFYKNWLSGSIENKYKPEYLDNDKTNSVIILEENRLITPNEGGVYKDYYYLLYKADKSHICLMPSWDDRWNSDCNPPPPASKEGLDNDCFYRDKIIKNIVGMCSGVVQMKPK